jgi:hypothetical protein
MALAPTSSHGSIATASVTLTNAQIIALPSTYPTIVPAQGSGTVIVPIMATYAAVLVAGYTNLARSVALVLDPVNNFNQVTAGIDSSALLSSSGVTVYAQDAAAALTVSGAATTNSVLTAAIQFGYDNAALTVASTSNLGALTGGNAGNSLLVRVWYVVSKLP